MHCARLIGTIGTELSEPKLMIDGTNLLDSRYVSQNQNRSKQTHKKETLPNRTNQNLDTQ